MSNSAMVDIKSSNDVSLVDIDGPTSVQDFMDKVFRKDAGLGAPKPIQATDDLAESELNATSALIERASQTIDVLASRCSLLESDLRQSHSAMAEQNALIETLKTFSTEMKRKVDGLEGNLRSALARCEAAETRVLSLEDQERTVALRAQRAETISSKLQQQVELAFGVGSPIRSVMNSVSLQQAAE